MAAADDGLLAGRYRLVELSVARSTAISRRTSAIVRALASRTGDAGAEPPVVVALTAAAAAAPKLVSIVEIAKRALASQGVRVFQYTALSARVLAIPTGPRGSRPRGDDDSDHDAFQIMGADTDDGAKKRSVPVMKIYLSTTSVRDLKNAYGEQACEVHSGGGSRREEEMEQCTPSCA